MIWLYLARESFVFRGGQVGRTIRQSWGLGRWIFASQVALFVQGYISYWVLAWTVGPTATGVFTACMTVALFSNPLLLGFSNILSPKPLWPSRKVVGRSCGTKYFETRC